MAVQAREGGLLDMNVGWLDPPTLEACWPPGYPAAGAACYVYQGFENGVVFAAWYVCHVWQYVFMVSIRVTYKLVHKVGRGKYANS